MRSLKIAAILATVATVTSACNKGPENYDESEIKAAQPVEEERQVAIRRGPDGGPEPVLQERAL